MVGVAAKDRDRPDGQECPSCGSLCTSSSDYCPNCGHIFERGGAEMCASHATSRASFVCVICQRTLCDVCVNTLEGRSVCADHTVVHMEQDFALVYSSSDINDAELAKAVLESLGFEVVTRDFQPIGYVWDGAGDSAFSRSALHKQAKVFVPIPDYLRGVEALEEWSEGREAEPEM